MNSTAFLNTRNEPSLINSKMKKEKLKNMERMKAELERRLISVKRDVSSLMSAISAKPKQTDHSEVEKKQKKAAELVHKLNAEKKVRLKKEKQRVKACEKRVQKEIDEESKRAKEKEEEALKKRKEETMKKHEILRRRREEDQKLTELTQSHTNFLCKDNEYLYRKIEHKFNSDIITPILEKKKQELAKRRNLYKPITKEELSTHLINYEQFIAQKEEERNKEVRARKEKEQSIQAELERYKTPTLQRQSLEKKQAQEEQERKKREKQVIREKMEFYANQVKELHPVIISKAKARELKEKMKKLKCEVRKPRDIRRNYDISSIIKKTAQSIDVTPKKPQCTSSTNLKRAKLLNRSISLTNKEAKSFSIPKQNEIHYPWTNQRTVSYTHLTLPTNREV
eukprot:TRINITY_DN1117_c0_g2_i22.p1 TRINITY_DN1117_c0_g2~~TRINITY_DN1117_c0_g2_i22.p1  ORF type:complete len:397 (-),score=134.48 TRINITY_DN1117_c0_g2_i22:18-1208(-)